MSNYISLESTCILIINYFYFNSIDRRDAHSSHTQLR